MNIPLRLRSMELLVTMLMMEIMMDNMAPQLIANVNAFPSSSTNEQTILTLLNVSSTWLTFVIIPCIFYIHLNTTQCLKFISARSVPYIHSGILWVDYAQDIHAFYKTNISESQCVCLRKMSMECILLLLQFFKKFFGYVQLLRYLLYYRWDKVWKIAGGGKKVNSILIW